jgi:hypothetical protein
MSVGGPIRVWVTLAGIALACGVTSACARPDPEPAGFVVQVRGDWELWRAGRAQPIAVRSILHVGDEVRKSATDPDAFVIAALYSGKMPQHVSDFRIEPAPQAGRFALVMRTIHSRFREDFITAAVRGGSSLTDAVVRGDAGGLDLVPVFAAVPPGRYSVTFYRVDDEGSVVRPAHATAAVAVQPGSARGPTLDNGLYQLEVTDPAAGVAGTAWIRVLTGPAYETASADLGMLEAAADARDARLQRANDAIRRTYLLVANGQPISS